MFSHFLLVAHGWRSHSLIEGIRGSSITLTRFWSIYSLNIFPPHPPLSNLCLSKSVQKSSGRFFDKGETSGRTFCPVIHLSSGSRSSFTSGLIILWFPVSRLVVAILISSNDIFLKPCWLKVKTLKKRREDEFPRSFRQWTRICRHQILSGMVRFCLSNDWRVRLHMYSVAFLRQTNFLATLTIVCINMVVILLRN